MDAPPLIAIGCDTFRDGSAEHLGEITGVRARYWEAVRRAGGVPVLVPHLEDPALIERVLDGVDGFILAGGDDLGPSRIGEPLNPKANPMPPRRETTDFALIEALLARSMPTLAICLGIQELNIARGGTIWQDLPGQRPDSPIAHNGTGDRYRLVEHLITIAPRSWLAALWGGVEATVNSSHHQAIRDLGEGLRAIAHTADGIVEAVVVDGHPEWMAVQWHPEYLVDDPQHRALFERLVGLARG